MVLDINPPISKRNNCSNCGWNIYGKGIQANKVKCTCNKKCIKYNQWKPVDNGIVKPHKEESEK